MSTSRVKKPTQLTLAINDLDFCYLPPRLSLSPMRHNDLVCTVDCSWFFSQGANHMVFELSIVGVISDFDLMAGEWLSSDPESLNTMR